MKIIDNTPIEDLSVDWGDPDGTGMKAKCLKQVQAFIKNKFLGLGYTFIGTATPSTTPMEITAEVKVFYIAVEEGDYTAFEQNGITELTILKSEEGRWVKEGLGMPFSIVTDLYGGYTDVESQIEAVQSYDGRLHFMNTEANHIRIGTASVQKIYYFPIEAGKKYKVTASVFSAASGLWGYASQISQPTSSNDIVDGKFVATSTISESDMKQPITSTISNAENYRYIVVNWCNDTEGTPQVIEINSVQEGGGIVDDIESLKNDKVDKEDGKTLIKENIANSLDVIESGEFIKVITDAEGRILFGITRSGDIYYGRGVPAKIKEYVDEKLANLPDLPYIPDVAESHKFEVAIGRIKSYGSYQSELEASPIVNDEANYYVGYENKSKYNYPRPLKKDIVAINYDDWVESERLATRRVQNKYNFSASFCALLLPFTSLDNMREYISSTKKMIKDGHELGLHALCRFSYWRTNKMYDVTPSGDSNFAPTKQEITTLDSDGKNEFGETITSDTTMADIFTSLNDPFYAGKYTSAKALTASDALFLEATQQFCLYSDIQKVDGIDDTIIDINTATTATTVSKTTLQWLELWYNKYVSDIGYSSEETNIADKFDEDYDIPEGATAANYYPDAAHLLSGKMVYWNDKTNPNYNDPSYQKVGKFKKGLYKDCFSTCNYEVMDRCIAAAQAFFHHHFGMTNFTDIHRHGRKDISSRYWKDDNGISFLDRDKTVIDSICGRYYVSHLGSFCKEYDILQSFGIFPLKEDVHRGRVVNEGQFGLYYGQSGIRNDYSNTAKPGFYGYVHYLEAFGTGTESSSGTYEEYETFLRGVDNWTKFIFENGGKSVTNNGKTLNVYDVMKRAMLEVMASKGTGKVPVFTFDTLVKNPSMYLAVDLFLRFCRDMGFDVTSQKSALDKVLSVERNVGGNLFPNPTFKQSILDYFGGSEDPDATYPDGWSNLSYNDKTRCSVENGILTMSSVDAGEQRTLWARAYGLPAGKYKMSYTVSSDDTAHKSKVNVYLVKNGDRLRVSESIKETVCSTTATDDFIEFEIENPKRKPLDYNNAMNILCDGYEDNVCCVEFKARFYDDIKISNVKLYKI